MGNLQWSDTPKSFHRHDVYRDDFHVVADQCMYCSNPFTITEGIWRTAQDVKSCPWDTFTKPSRALPHIRKKGHTLHFQNKKGMLGHIKTECHDLRISQTHHLPLKEPKQHIETETFEYFMVNTSSNVPKEKKGCKIVRFGQATLFITHFKSMNVV